MEVEHRLIQKCGTGTVTVLNNEILAHNRKTIFWGHIRDLIANLSFSCKLRGNMNSGKEFQPERYYQLPGKMAWSGGVAPGRWPGAISHVVFMSSATQGLA